jgi:hypothetical protein
MEELIKKNKIASKKEIHFKKHLSELRTENKMLKN